jgi:hypothetical protein
MREAVHMQSVESWARFVRDHPAEWKQHHTEFVNAQYDKHAAFLRRLRQESKGKETIVRQQTSSLEC